LRSVLSLIFVVSATLTSFHGMFSGSPQRGLCEIHVNRQVGAGESAARALRRNVARIHTGGVCSVQ